MKDSIRDSPRGERRADSIIASGSQVFKKQIMSMSMSNTAEWSRKNEVHLAFKC